MPNYYSVAVQMDKTITYSAKVWIETNAEVEHLKNDYPELVERIKTHLKGKEDDYDFWEEDNENEIIEVFGFDKSEDRPDDEIPIEWESPSLATDVVDLVEEIAEKDKEIEELKKQLGKKDAWRFKK